MKLDRIGRFLSNVVFQNISGLMALGMIRIFFGPAGWWPNPDIYRIVDPMLHYFIPILFAYTGGKMIGGKRGGVIAAFVTLGLEAGNTAPYPMILPAMVIGPFVGFLISKTDNWLEARIPVGFELLIYNLAAGFIGVSFTFLGFFFVNPLIREGTHLIFTWAALLAESTFLPIVALIIEPGKVLFFNNVINHGILEPLGINQTKDIGKSIFFLLETNPGPGFGLLLAYYFLLKGKRKLAVKSSLVIQGLGGIHEVYFPYVLMKPWLLIPLILAGMTGNLLFYLLNAGLVATPSPGSIIILLMMAPKDTYIAVLAGVGISALVSFLGSVYVLSRLGVEDSIQPSQEMAISSEQEEEKREGASFIMNERNQGY